MRIGGVFGVISANGESPSQGDVSGGFVDQGAQRQLDLLSNRQGTVGIFAKGTQLVRDDFELVARIDRMVIYCVRLIRGLTVELDIYKYLRFSRDKIALTKT